MPNVVFSNQRLNFFWGGFWVFLYEDSHATVIHGPSNVALLTGFSVWELWPSVCFAAISPGLRVEWLLCSYRYEFGMVQPCTIGIESCKD
jgi:hypothetical protein